MQAEENLARTRLALAKAEYEDVKRRFEVGTAGHDSLTAAEQQLHAMELAVQRLRLNLAEIQATSAAPRDDLDAPLIGRRDFVRERLMLQLQMAQQALVAAEQARAEAVQRARVGVASRLEELRSETELLEARNRMQLLQNMLDLRQQHLRGSLTSQQLATAQRRAELMAAAQRAEQELVLARSRLEEIRRQARVGLADQLEAKRAELAVLEREMELTRIRVEIDALKRD